MRCRSVQHIRTYSSSFTEQLQELLGDSFADFGLLSNVEKTPYVCAR